MNAKRKNRLADAGCDSPRVCLGLTNATAQEVCIAGSFNDWHPGATPIVRQDDGKWAKELALPPVRYEYRFVVAGCWVDDPAATELIPNPFGTPNTVLEVRSTSLAPLARSGAAAHADIPPKRTIGNFPPPSRATAQRGVSTSVAAMSR